LNLSSDEQPEQVISCSTTNQKCTLSLKAIPIPDVLVQVLLKYSDEAKLFSDFNSREPLKSRLLSALDEYLRENSTNEDWHSLLEDIICFGPKKSGPNCLINQCSNGTFEEYSSSIVSGFQLFANAGPLCAEPLSGVCIILTDISTEGEVEKSAIMGQLVSTMREGCKQCFLRYSPRISLAIYQVDLQAPCNSYFFQFIVV
jgi:ribosome assembly protein 1